MNKRLDLLNRDEFVGNVTKIINQLSDIKKVAVLPSKEVGELVRLL